MEFHAGPWMMGMIGLKQVCVFNHFFPSCIFMYIITLYLSIFVFSLFLIVVHVSDPDSPYVNGSFRISVEIPERYQTDCSQFFCPLKSNILFETIFPVTQWIHLC